MGEDTLLFVYGLVFLLLAFVCTTVRSQLGKDLPLRHLRRFGFLHGLFEWTLLANLYLPDQPVLGVLSSLLLTGSGVALLRAGQDQCVDPRGRSPWLTLLALAPVLLAFPSGLDPAMARYTLLLPGGLLTGWRLLSAAAGSKDEPPLRAMGAAWIGYGLTAGLVVAPHPALPAWLPTNADLHAIGFPIEVIRILLMGVVLAGLHNLSVRMEYRDYPFAPTTPGRPHLSRFAFGLAAILILGSLVTHALGRHAARTALGFLEDQAAAVAGLLDAGNDADAERIRHNLDLAVESSNRIDAFELLRIDGDQCRLLLHTHDTAPPLLASTMVQAEAYDDFLRAPPDLTRLSQRQFTCTHGSWFAGAARLSADLMGVGGDLWLRAHRTADAFLFEVRLHRLAGILITAILALGVADYYSHQRRAWLITLGALKAEDALRTLNRDLEQTVQQRTRSLARINQQLEDDMIREKAAQEAIRQAEQKYRTLTEQLPAVTYTVDLGDPPVTVYISPQIERIFGYTADEWLSAPNLWRDLMVEDDQTRVERTIQSCNRTGEPFDLVYRSRTRDGSIIWLRNSARYLRDAEGMPIQTHGVIFDITTERRREAELKESGEVARLLFEQSPIGLFFYNTDLVITECNNAFSDIVRASKDALIGLDMHNLTDQRILPAIRAVLDRQSSRYEGPYHTTTSGRDFTMRIRTTPVYDADGNLRGGLSTVEDISEEQQVFDEQNRAQKLESLGLLAGGIAHDFNNILTAVLGNISMIRSFAGLDTDEGRVLLEESEKAAFRARDLTQQLLTFAKGGVPVKQVQTISGTVRDAAQFAVRGSKSRCRVQVPEDEWAVNVDAGQIGQVIQNLAINADQAMPEGGVIDITLHNQTLAEGEQPGLPPGRYLHIEVRDEGTGIPREQLTRIFDPYYTTKQKGSGLGLATSYTILRRHDGRIVADSDSGQGSTFHLYLPACAEAPVEASGEPAVHLRPEHDPRHILVMDDEPAVRTLATRILERYGFRVDTAPDGEAAIERFRQAAEEGDPFHLVILDLTVPGGMGGEETFARLRDLDPEVRGIVSSGYSSGEVMGRYRDHGFAAVFPKPYRAEDLVQTVLAHARPTQT